jgi:hypothetical protein
VQAFQAKFILRLKSARAIAIGRYTNAAKSLADFTDVIVSLL